MLSRKTPWKEKIYICYSFIKKKINQVPCRQKRPQSNANEIEASHRTYL